MSLSNAQSIGLGLVGVLSAAALLFNWYVAPRVNAIFRPSIKTAMYWFIAILFIQTGFIVLGK